MKKADVMWVGLSAKKSSDLKKFTPLHIDSNTGKLVAEIETQCNNIGFYKTNLVKFAPLDSLGKLRYPTAKECEQCFPILQLEIQAVNPQVVILLGIATATFVLHKLGLQMPSLSYEFQAFEFEKRWYVPIHHPSFIMVYRRKEKDKYIEAVRAIVERLINQS